MTEIVKPFGRTLAEFQPLKPAEQKLLEACRQGAVADISKERPAAATNTNTVRAAFLRFLALGGDEQNPLHERGVKLQGAWVEGTFDLYGARVPGNLSLHHCHFSDVPVLLDSHIHGTLSLEGSHVNGLNADRMVCDGSVFLRNGFTANGKIRLLGAQIGGHLACSGALLDGKQGDVLSCDGVVIKGDVFLNDGFTASGTVRLVGAQIGGSLDCSGAKLDSKEGDALACDRAVIKGSVFLREGFTANGAVRLLSAQIGGNLNCKGPSGGHAARSAR